MLTEQTARAIADMTRVPPIAFPDPGEQERGRLMRLDAAAAAQAAEERRREKRAAELKTLYVRGVEAGHRAGYWAGARTWSVVAGVVCLLVGITIGAQLVGSLAVAS